MSEKVGNRNFSYKKSLQLAQHKKDINALLTECDLRQRNGFAVEYIPSVTLEQDFGIQAPGALFTQLAADTDAYPLTHHILQFNIARGLKVYDRSRAVKFSRKKDHQRVLLQNGCYIDCTHIVYANGYEAANLVPRGKLRLQSTYVTISESISRPLPFWKDDCLVWTTGHPYLYLRTTPDARILVGGRDEETISPARRDKLISSKARHLGSDFCKRIPGIPFSSEFSWTGIFASTPDGLPYIGELPGKKHQYVALGYGGNGISFSLVAAIMITDLICGKPNSDLDIFTLNR